MATPRIWLLTVSPRNPATGAVVTTRLAGGGTRGFTQFGSTAWKAGLSKPPVIAQKLGFDDGQFGEGAVVQALQLVWGGRDADAKAMAALYWKDASFTLHSGPDGGTDGEMALILSGRIADATTGMGQLILQMADPAIDLTKPVVTATFAGTGGIEGDAEIKGQPKWRAWGKNYNVTLRSLVKASNIWVCTDPAFPINVFDQVYDRGNAASSLTLVNWAGSIAATLAALIATAAPAGGAAVAPSISCIKWWYANPGKLTCDIRGEIGAGYVDRPADIAAKIIALAGGPAVDGTMLTAARTARNHEAGWLVTDTGTTIASEITELLSGVSLWWALSAAGVVEMGPWEWGASVSTLSAARVERVQTFRPVSKVSLGWKRNNTVMNRGDIAEVVLYGDVSGAPTSLADINAGEGSKLTGIEAGANVTATHTAAAITGQGALATQNDVLIAQQLGAVGGGYSPDPRFGDQSFWSHPLDALGWYFENHPSFGSILSLWSGHPTNVPGTSRKHCWSLMTLSPPAGSKVVLGALIQNFSNQNCYVTVRFFDALGANIGDISIIAPPNGGPTLYFAAGNVPTAAAKHQFIIYNAAPGLTFTGATFATSITLFPASAYSDGTLADALRPAEAGSNITESRVAAAIAGQGPAATDPRGLEALYSNNANVVFDGGLSLNGSRWGLYSGWYVSPGAYGEGNYLFNSAGGTIFAISDTFPAGPGFTLSLQAELFTGGVTAGGLYVDVECFNSSGVSIGSVAQITRPNGLGWGRVRQPGTTPAGTNTARVRVYLYTATNTAAAARRIKVSGGNLDVPFSDEATNSALWATGQNIDALRPAEFGANVTGTNTAAAIAGQAAWATYTGLVPTNVSAQIQFLDTGGNLSALDRINNRRLTLLNRADGVTAVTEAAVVTSFGTAAAIAGQVDWATYTGINTSNMAGRVSRLTASDGRVTDGRALNSNNNFGLRSLFDPPTFTDTDSGSSITINITSMTFYTDWATSITFPSGSLPGLAYATRYYIWRNQADPTSTGTSWAASTSLLDALGTGKVYVGTYLTRVFAAPPPPPSSGGGSGGGGGFCVSSDALVHLAKGGECVASEVEPGMVILCLADDRDGIASIDVQSNDLEHEVCVRVITESGISLELSHVTPMELGNGRTCQAHACHGQLVPVVDQGEFRWERVVDVTPTGHRHVSQIRCHNATYAAGDQPGRAILSHNPDKP